MSGLRNTSSWRAKLISVHGPARRWLTDQGSLTRRIIESCPRFSVRHLHQYSGRADPDESEMCGLSVKPSALLREVFLYCRETPVVFAHSVLPYSSLRGAWTQLGRLGNRPLGTALFANPCVRRAPLEFKRLDARHPLYRRACAQMDQRPAYLWARRSLFQLRGRRILVTEVFLRMLLELS
ncbi:MAG: chorismate--pyruvate lyase family protein [Sulfuriferula sp.]